MANVNKLQAFLYLLMRDELPTGAVVKVVNQVTAITECATSLPPEEVTYTSEHLAAYAKQLAERLLSTPPSNDPGFRLS